MAHGVGPQPESELARGLGEGGFRILLHGPDTNKHKRLDTICALLYLCMCILYSVSVFVCVCVCHIHKHSLQSH